ncbi:DUF1993 domain-containing protein [Leeia aquatica]|uniref:DUF1993 domain-containing protein n=1 Tax=Leeia aquatica TaxID=2725557 RepID=A0A847SDQ3_9NEIS|nr:DUF1993 domain-containing protein [Leeia aquatica]NLR75566.1 DUF1993 domain-containing protein [Leeia aquatica]
MSLSMYQASAPVFQRMLRNLKTLLQKAEAHAEARKFDAANLLNFRLYPDMFPLTRQVQIATDAAKGAMARLAGVDIPSWEDVETTLPELIARIDKALAYVESFRPEQIDGSEDRAITVQLRSGPLHFTGQEFLLSFALPNLFFHVTTAYNILRHNGVEIGKRDYLG